MILKTWPTIIEAYLQQEVFLPAHGVFLYSGHDSRQSSQGISQAPFLDTLMGFTMHTLRLNICINLSM